MLGFFIATSSFADLLETDDPSEAKPNREFLPITDRLLTEA